MSDYAKASRGVNRSHNTGGSPVPMPPPGRCCVPGCQLPGATSDSTTGSNDWYCRLHRSSDYASRGNVTAKINNRIGAYRLAYRCLNAPLAARIPPQVENLLRQLGRAELLDSAIPLFEGAPITARALGMHMISVLDKECRQVQKGDTVVEKRDGYDTWFSASAIVREELAA